jgi:hypothetical protein
VHALRLDADADAARMPADAEEAELMLMLSGWRDSYF